MEVSSEVNEIFHTKSLRVASWTSLVVGAITEVVGVTKSDQATMQAGLFFLGVGAFGRITANMAAGCTAPLAPPYGVEDSGQQG